MSGGFVVPGEAEFYVRVLLARGLSALKGDIEFGREATKNEEIVKIFRLQFLGADSHNVQLLRECLEAVESLPSAIRPRLTDYDGSPLFEMDYLNSRRRGSSK